MEIVILVLMFLLVLLIRNRYLHIVPQEHLLSLYHLVFRQLV
jgi:hypothetical protein